jgi:hypothetical protein
VAWSVAEGAIDQAPRNGLLPGIDLLMSQLLSADVDAILGRGDYACVVDDGRYPTAESPWPC